MESVSEDEARNLASRWTRRYESAILARTNSDRKNDPTTLVKLPNSEESKSSVMYDYRTYENNNGTNYHESLLSNSYNSGSFGKKSERNDTERQVQPRSCSTDVDDIELSNNARYTSGLNRPLIISPSTKREEAFPNIAATSSGSDGQGGEIGSCVSLDLQEGKRTPRPDPVYLRQKRLQHFAFKRNSKTESDEKANIGPVARDVNGLKTCDHGRENATTGSESLSRENKAGINGCIETNRKSRFGAMPSYHFKDEEDEFRLDLWGLKDAVMTGQVDLRSYLPLMSAADNCSLTGNNKESSNISSLPYPTTTDEHKDCYDAECKKLGRTYFDSNSVHKVEEEKLFELSRPNEEKLPNVVRTINLPLENVRYSINSGCQIGCKASSPPEPQIKGPLYSGFDTQSDSEGSVTNFVIKKDNLMKHADQCHNFSSHYFDQSTVEAKTLVVNKQNSTVPSKSLTHKDPNCKTRDRRGKEKILSELTEYMNTKRSVRKNVSDGYVNSTTKPVAISKCKELKTWPFSSEDSDVALRQDCCTSSDYEGQLEENNFLEMASKEPFTVYSSDINNDVFELDEDIINTPFEENTTETGTFKAKMCPHCKEVNNRAANWCIECGFALIKVRPLSITSQKGAHYKKETLGSKNRVMENCHNTENSLNIFSKSAPDKTRDESTQLQLSIEQLSIEASCSEAFSDGKYSSSPVGYKRRWLKSSTAWNTFNTRELSKPSSLDDNIEFNKNTKGIANWDNQSFRKVRSSSDLSVFSNNNQYATSSKTSRGRSSSQRRTLSSGQSNGGGNSQKSKSVKSQKSNSSLTHPFTKLSAHEKPIKEGLAEEQNLFTRSQSAVLLNGGDCSDNTVSKTWEPDIPSRISTSRCPVPPLDLSDLATYDRIVTLIRFQRESDPLPWLCLPDEILLQIFCFLSHKDLASCARVCQQFYRIASDETLWKVIVLRKSENICDGWLNSIGKRHPVCLTISHCHGMAVSSEGLRSLFRSCSARLQELDFSGCNGGELIGESILLHVAARCTGLKSVDASWSNVSDNGVQALAEQVERLECLCLNGCQAITDASLQFVAKKHGKSLRILEVFGCFNITPAGLSLVGKSCTHLETLNIGQCYKITDSAIGSLVSVQTELENLDLRGCKQTRDASVKKIVRHCPHLTSLVLANCPLITNVSLAEIATSLPRIRTLDFCGCANVTDSGVRALAKSCQSLEILDLSSTGITSKSVTALANYCSQSLITLKLSFCLDITDTTVNHLAKHCKKLATLHLYGCKRVRDIQTVRSTNGSLHIER